jgi:hypothetical protein
MTDTLDPDVIAAAKAIYGNRLDQKYGGNRRWRQLVADYPQLAEAAKPLAPQRSNGPKAVTSETVVCSRRLSPCQRQR